MMVSDEYDSLVVKNPEHLSVEFFTHLSQLPLIRRLAALACNGVHIEKLIFDWDYFRKNHIAIPPSIEEQRRISEVLNACDKEIELLKQQLDALKRQKRGLMQKLLTGQIRVKVEDIEAVTAEAS
jgi:type I restriction enzyme S subunit